MDYQNRKVYLLVDGENIDRTLGQILSKKPKPDQRPRWDKVKIFLEKKFQANCRALFFLNANDGVNGSFIQALKMVDFIPIPLVGPPETKVVDQGIIKMLGALKSLTSRQKLPAVALVSHDADFKAAFAALQDDHHLSIVCFNEFLSGEYREIPGLQVFDLEEDVKAFKEEMGPLPRLRQIDVEEFDPYKYL
jgi:uncharacterized protein